MTCNGLRDNSGYRHPTLTERQPSPTFNLHKEHRRMCIDLFDHRNPSIPVAQWRPSAAETARLHKIAQREHAPGRLVCELMMYQNLVFEHKNHFDELAFCGLLHRIDETRLALAMSPAVDEIDLNLKIAFLAHAKPCIRENQNLRAMILAGHEADITRLRPDSPRFRPGRRAD